MSRAAAEAALGQEVGAPTTVSEAMQTPPKPLRKTRERRKGNEGL
jgi:hypothetical protein